MKAMDFQVAYVTRALAVGEVQRFAAYNFLGLRSTTGTVWVGANGHRADTPWDVHQDAWDPDAPLGDVLIYNPTVAEGGSGGSITVNFITCTKRVSWNPLPGGIAQSVSLDASTITLPISNASLTTIATNTGNDATSNSNLDTNLGAKADASATTDTGTFSLIALIKRLLGKFAALPTAIGQQAMAASMSVTIANNQSAVPVGATAAAAADGFANPTTSPLACMSSLYNNATWDRQRSNFNVNTGDTGAKTATGNGATQTNYNAKGAVLLFSIGTVSGTTPTCTFKLQGSADGGTTWFDIPGAATASITATGTYVLAIYPGATVAANAAVSYPLPRTWRVVWTIGGTTPSFTITNVQVAYVL